MDEDHPLVPRSPYGISKLAAEQYVRLYAQTYEVPCLSVRPFSVYGPGQRKLVVYDLMRRIIGGENPLIIQSPAEVMRDFVFVRDVARAMIRLSARAPAEGEPYNLASGVGIALNELAERLLAASGKSVEVKFTGSLRVGDPLRWRGDTSRARRLGIECATQLWDGVRETMRWVQDDLRES